MKKRILVTAVAGLIWVAGSFMSAGCADVNADAKLTREEWDGAWKASVEAKNYSCKYEYWYASPSGGEQAEWVCDEVKFENNKIDYEKKDFKAYINCRDKTYEAYSLFAQDESIDGVPERTMLKTFRKWEDENSWTPEYGCNYLISGYFVPDGIGEWFCGAGTGNGSYAANYDKYKDDIDSFFLSQTATGAIDEERIDGMLKTYATVGLPADMYDYFTYDSQTQSYSANLFLFKTLTETTVTVSFEGGKLKTLSLADGGQIVMKTTFYDYGTTTVTADFLLENGN